MHDKILLAIPVSNGPETPISTCINDPKLPLIPRIKRDVDMSRAARLRRANLQQWVRIEPSILRGKCPVLVVRRSTRPNGLGLAVMVRLQNER